MKKTLWLLLGVFAFCVWLLWPVIIATVLGAGLPSTLGCDRIDLFAKIGDSYGSLNSLAAIFAGSVATWALLTQRTQIQALELQQCKTTSMQLVGIFYSLNAQDSTDQRIAVLEAIVASVNLLPEFDRQNIYSSVRLNAKESAIVHKSENLKTIRWGMLQK